MTTSTENSIKPRKFWSADEDKILREEVAKQHMKNGEVKDWRTIAQRLPERNNRDCRKRWIKLDGPINKGPWRKDEDQRLQDAVTLHSTVWTEVSQYVRTRHADQCAKRWQHFLDPELDHSEWTLQEDQCLLAKVEQHGNNWRKIVDEDLQGRSATDAKNRYSILQRNRKKLSQASSTPFNPSPEHYQYQPCQIPVTSGQLDPRSMGNLNNTDQEWSPNVLDMFNEHLSLPMDSDKASDNRQHLAMQPFTMPPEISYQASGPESLNYFPEVKANIAQDGGSLLDGCTAMDMDWAELASIAAFAPPESTKATQNVSVFTETGAFPSPNSIRGEEELGDEDGEGDSDGDDDIQMLPYQNQFLSPLGPTDDTQKKVTMTLKDVEANLVEKVLGLILSSNSKVDIKISTQE